MKKKALLLLTIAIFIFASCSSKSYTETEDNSADTTYVAATHEFEVEKDIEWAKPKDFSLTMDIYIPKTGRDSYPVLVIFHGGGWLINNKSIMNQMSEYVAGHAEYVVCNVNYRLLVDNENTTMMNEIIEDAMGAVLWIKENIAEYGGNPKKIAVTGDSAGGHLAAMVMVAGGKLSSTGFEEKPLGFRPTYIPEGKTTVDITAVDGLEVQAVVLSYPAIDIYKICKGSKGDGYDGLESPSNMFWELAKSEAKNIFGKDINVEDNPECYKICSANYDIPTAESNNLPPVFCHVGTKDDLITPELLKPYLEQLKKAGYKVDYWEHKDRPHAYLDSGSNEYLKTSFEKDAIEPLEKIIEFLNGVFY